MSAFCLSDLCRDGLQVPTGRGHCHFVFQTLHPTDRLNETRVCTPGSWKPQKTRGLNGGPEFEVASSRVEKCRNVWLYEFFMLDYGDWPQKAMGEKKKTSRSTR